MSKTFTARLSRSMIVQAKKMAKKQGITFADLLRSALRRYIAYVNETELTSPNPSSRGGE